MLCGATQDGRIMMESSDKMWPTGEGNDKPLQCSCLENPMNSMKRQNDRILKEELPRWVGAQHATGDQWRNNSRKNEGMEPKPKQYPAVDVTGDRSKVRCCKEQYCIGTWNVRSMNQGKLEVVKQEMARVKVNILGISELKWTGMGEFNSGDHCNYYGGQESLRRNGVARIVNKRVQNAVKWSEVAHLCPTLCDPMDSSLHQAPLSTEFPRQEVLEWVAISFSSTSPKCSTWMQSQKWQNDLCAFLRQTIQYHSDPRLYPEQ